MSDDKYLGVMTPEGWRKHIEILREELRHAEQCLERAEECESRIRARQRRKLKVIKED